MQQVVTVDLARWLRRVGRTQSGLGRVNESVALVAPGLLRSCLLAWFFIYPSHTGYRGPRSLRNPCHPRLFQVYRIKVFPVTDQDGAESFTCKVANRFGIHLTT